MAPLHGQRQFQKLLKVVCTVLLATKMWISSLDVSIPDLVVEASAAVVTSIVETHAVQRCMKHNGVNFIVESHAAVSMRLPKAFKTLGR